MKPARWIFRLSGIYGLIFVAPLYFMESSIGRDYPPAISHPEYFYGFLGVTLAWQIVFLVVAQDPVRYRVIMLPSILEKAGFGIAALILYAQHRLPFPLLISGCADLAWGTLFVFSFIRTGPGTTHAGARA